ncbi:MAG: sugar phosphate isomerase/epimerase family protein, partial [Angustibacter sp.]
AAELIEMIGPTRLRLVADTWHLWTSDQDWVELAELPGHWISTAHLSDCGPKQGAFWADSDRTALPGDGLVPLPEAVAAIAATGFSGPWAVELFSDYYREWEPDRLARELHRRVVQLIRSPHNAPRPTILAGQKG